MLFVRNQNYSTDIEIRVIMQADMAEQYPEHCCIRLYHVITRHRERILTTQHHVSGGRFDITIIIILIDWPRASERALRGALGRSKCLISSQLTSGDRVQYRHDPSYKLECFNL